MYYVYVYYVYMYIMYLYTPLVAQTVERLPAMRKTRVWFLGQEDPLEQEMAIHSSTLAWKSPWTEDRATVHGVAKSRTQLSDFTFLSYYVYAYHYSTIRMYVVQKNVLMICFRKMLSFVKILIIKFLKYVTIT